MRRLRFAMAVPVATVLGVGALMSASGNPSAPAETRESRNVSAEERKALLTRAQVWSPPAVESNRGHPTTAQSFVECKFIVTDLGGTAQKFDCVLDSGEQIRVKYGRTPEIPSEIAATGLLRLLGFGADEVRPVARLRCHGCPAEPFLTAKAADATNTQEYFKKLVRYDNHKDFKRVAVERKHHGQPITSDGVKGWAFHELDQIDANRGGAPGAHVDALRLMAVLLAHWDNKSENQRLVCLSDWNEGESCQQPFALLQDVGAAFGPKKVDLTAWERTPIWTNRAQCTTDMATLPYDGATFAPVTITEAGRQHLGAGLRRVSDDQLRQLFASARFDEPRFFPRSRTGALDDWMRVFKQKVSAITDGPACPS